MMAPVTHFMDEVVPAAWDRALVYGDGLFETIACVNGEPLLFEYHLARLQAGLQRLGIVTDVSAIQDRVKTASRAAGDAVIRLVVGRAGGERGYDPSVAQHSVVQLSVFSPPRYPHLNLLDGIALHVCHHRLPRNPALAGMKHLNRLDQVLAASEWDRSQAADGLMLNDLGQVIEGTFTNVFLWQAGGLYTPDLSACGVAGVMRAFILDWAGKQGWPVHVMDLNLDAFLQAEACFVCNSVFGIWPVRTIADSVLTQKRAEIDRLMRVVCDMGYGQFYA